jgi:uncharacterized Zn finger protein (UPF0148 family)
MAIYEVKKGLMGHKVLYSCPNCGVPLTSSLDKAGTNDACPDCGQPHVIPGVREKSDMDRAAAAQQRQKQDEAARRKAAAAAAAAAKSTPKPIPPTLQPISISEELTGPPRNTSRPQQASRRRSAFSDSILDIAFAVARGFSVVVIVLSLLALLAIVALFIKSYTGYRTVQVVALKTPTDAEFKSYVNSRNDPSPESSDSNGSQSTAGFKSSTEILRKHGLTQDGLRYQLLERTIDGLYAKLDWDEHQKFLDALDQFLQRQKDKLLAAEWFCNEYETKYESREIQLRADELHNQIVSARLWLLATTAAAVFGGLISFMVLPLLIRIEANTREVPA